MKSRLTFDHIHLISRDPRAAADWYCDKFGGEVSAVQENLRGAPQIDVRVGGISEMIIRDDGAGIPADQLETAFARHATSKLVKAEDLFAITTLGFRGRDAGAPITSTAANLRVDIPDVCVADCTYGPAAVLLHVENDGPVDAPAGATLACQ